MVQDAPWQLKPPLTFKLLDVILPLAFTFADTVNFCDRLALPIPTFPEGAKIRWSSASFCVPIIQRELSPPAPTDDASWYCIHP